MSDTTPQPDVSVTIPALIAGSPDLDRWFKNSMTLLKVIPNSNALMPSNQQLTDPSLPTLEQARQWVARSRAYVKVYRDKGGRHTWVKVWTERIDTVERLSERWLPLSALRKEQAAAAGDTLAHLTWEQRDARERLMRTESPEEEDSEDEDSEQIPLAFN